MNDGKTLRFDRLVQESGAPEEATLWAEPEKDPDFMKAVKENRIVTVHHNEAGTDYGLVGFFPEKNTVYFIFPKKLKAAAKSRVVGIKYPKLASSKPKGAVVKVAEKRRRKEGKGHPKEMANLAEAKKSEPESLKNYTAALHFRIETSVELAVEAPNATEAKKLLQEQAAKAEPGLKNAQIYRKLGSVKQGR